jgi:hypothetical protein
MNELIKKIGSLGVILEMISYFVLFWVFFAGEGGWGGAVGWLEFNREDHLLEIKS